MILFLSFYSINIFVLNDFDHESYYIMMVMELVLYLIIAHIFKTKNDVLNKYLDKLKKKWNIEQNYRQMINDLQEGIIIIDKKFQILYQSMPVSTIFGLEN